jgi:hypothetical protein
MFSCIRYLLRLKTLNSSLVVRVVLLLVEFSIWDSGNLVAQISHTKSESLQFPKLFATLGRVQQLKTFKTNLSLEWHSSRMNTISSFI